MRWLNLASDSQVFDPQNGPLSLRFEELWQIMNTVPPRQLMDQMRRAVNLARLQIGQDLPIPCIDSAREGWVDLATLLGYASGHATPGQAKNLEAVGEITRKAWEQRAQFRDWTLPGDSGGGVLNGHAFSYYDSKAQTVTLILVRPPRETKGRPATGRFSTWYRSTGR